MGSDPAHHGKTQRRVRQRHRSRPRRPKQGYGPLTDGKELDAYRPAPEAITTPTSNDGIVTKFRDVTDGVIDTDRRAHIEQVVLGLDKEPNLEGLFDLLAPPVKSPFAET